MNSAQFYIKKNGSFVKLDGNAVFPFRWGELLDERLDEAYLNTRRSVTESYTPTTVIKAVLSDGTNEREEYFALARDGSVRFPNWAQTFKHEMYLIELTKLWEGILCPSMTFTNALKTAYDVARAANKVLATGNLPSAFDGIPSIVSPIDSSIDLTLPSLATVGQAIANAENSGVGSWIYTESTPSGKYSYIRVIANDNELINSTQTGDFTISSTSLQGVTKITAIYDVLIYNSLSGISTAAAYVATFDIYVIKNFGKTKPWTVTDCVTRIFECAEPLRKGESPRYRLDGVEYIGGNLVYYDQENDVKYRPGSEAEKYDKVYIPDNLSMTQCTLREALKVVGSLIHAEPWLDADNVAHFKPYGSTEASGLASKTPVYDSFSNDINQYATEVRSNAQNLISTLGYASGTIYDPSRYLYKSVRPNVAYARVEEGNAVAKADRTIYTVEEVRCGLINADGTGWAIQPCDITPYVFEATEYNANLSSFEGGFPYSKSYAIYYTIGGNTLEGLFYKVPDAATGGAYENFAITNILGACNVDGLSTGEVDDLIVEHIADLVFQIVYKPLSSQTVAHGKQEYVKGETPYVQISNQSENLIESDWYGENLKGISARLGNVERERTYIVRSLNDIPEIGQMLDGYAISAVSVEMMPYFFKVGVGLTKNFNRISEYVGISSAKRFYEVSERDTYNRDILMREFLVIGPVPNGYSNEGKLFRDISGVRDIFTADPGTYDPVTLGRLFTYDQNNDTLWMNFYPIIPRALGNAITFTFSAKDNYAAGETLVYHEGENGVEGWWGSDARYTDFYGRAYWARIDLYPSVVDVPPSVKAELARKFPQVTGDMLQELPDAVVTTDTAYHRLRKDNREIISYTLELEVKTTVKGLNVGSGIAKLCRMVSSQEGAVKPHLYYAKTPINKFDATINTLDTSAYTDCGEIRVGEMQGNGTFKLTGAQLQPIRSTEYFGWIIAIPSSVTSEQYSEDNGVNVTVPKYSGGNVLISREIKFTPSTDSGITPAVLLEDICFYVE